MPDDEGFEQRPNVRWENDFGPATPMWQRYLMAAACMALVLGFLAVAIFLFREPGAEPPIGPGGGAALVAFLALLAVVALRAERWAIRIRRFFERKTGGSLD